MMRGVVAHRVLFGMLAGGLAITAAVAQTPDPARAPPANFRSLAKHGIANVITDRSVVGTVEYAEPRAAIAPQPGDWIICVRSVTATNTHYFSVFIDGASVPLVRRAVGIDRCAGDAYAPLPEPAPPAKKPAATRKPKLSAAKPAASSTGADKTPN